MKNFNRFSRSPITINTVATYSYVLGLRETAYATGDARMQVLTDAFLGASKTDLGPRAEPAAIEAFFAAKRAA